MAPKAKLPQAVREAAQKSDEALQGLEGERDRQIAANTAAAHQAAGLPPPGDDPVQPAPTPTPPPIAAAPTGQPAPSDDTDWKAKHDAIALQLTTLVGKYNAEVPAYAEQNRQLRQLNEQLTAELAAIKVPGAGAAGSAAATAASADLPWTDEQINVLGVDALEAIRATVRAEVRGTVKNEVTAAVAPVVQNQRQEALNRFWAAFLALVPDHEAINAMPEFQAFMGQRDKRSRKELGKLLHEAFADLDVEACASFYLDFKQAQGLAASPPASEKPDPMARRVVPGPAAGPAPQRAQPKAVYKQSEVDDFFKKVKLRKSGLTPQQVIERTHEYMAASQEGRIINGV